MYMNFAIREVRSAVHAMVVRVSDEDTGAAAGSGILGIQRSSQCSCYKAPRRLCFLACSPLCVRTNHVFCYNLKGTRARMDHWGCAVVRLGGGRLH